MRFSTLAMGLAVSSVLWAQHASGQQIRQPSSFRPVAYEYDYYSQGDAAASPSDQPVAPAASGTANGEAATATAAGGCDAAACGCANGGGCTATCNGSCNGGCSSCGCGGLLGLGDHLACCELGDPWTLSGSVHCDPVVKIGGWVQLGYHNRANGLFNDHPDDLNLHQAWVYLEKEADGSDCCWDWGFRLDGLYGVDAQDTQAFGNPVDAAGDPQGWDNDWDHGIYGFALPQAYVTLARGDLSVQAGHFYTRHGYEVVPATGNFFYSHAITFYNSEPFTHTGFMADYQLREDLKVFGGWVLGWDTGYDQFEDGSAFMGGVSADLADDVGLVYAAMFGDFGFRGDDGFLQSLVLTLDLTERVQYVLHSDWLSVDPVGGGQEQNYSIVQYLFYNYSDCLALGTRLEWWKGDAINPYEPFGSTAPATGNQSYYEVTGGFNYKPHANLVLRPEVRLDWSPALNYDETTLGIDMILTF